MEKNDTVIEAGISHPAITTVHRNQSYLGKSGSGERGGKSVE
jgi:hypothetical protein